MITNNNDYHQRQIILNDIKELEQNKIELLNKYNTDKKIIENKIVELKKKLTTIK